MSDDSPKNETDLSGQDRRSASANPSDHSRLYDYESLPLVKSAEKKRNAIRPWILAALAVGLLLFAWQNVKKPVKQSDWAGLPQGETAPDAILEGFHLISSHQGVKQWELYSQSARLFQKNKEAFAEQVYVEYYKDNKIISTLTADKGVINTQTNDTYAEGHVELITENGAKLETSKLRWNSKTEMITTDARVHIYKGLDDITAMGMEADAQLGAVRFMRDVHTRVRDAGEIEKFERAKRF